MNYRDLGRTGWKVSDISFGAWAIGGTWGSVDDTESLAALNSAIDCGVNFIDTADVYGMGRSERLIAQLKRDRKEEIVVATKAGRRLSPHTAEGYNALNLTRFVAGGRVDWSALAPAIADAVHTFNILALQQLGQTANTEARLQCLGTLRTHYGGTQVDAACGQQFFRILGELLHVFLTQVRADNHR